MRCPTLSELPPPPPDKTGWPWAEDSPQLPDSMPDGSPWPRVSIVTPSYNQGQFLEENILSILNQDYPNIQHVIVDGASTDNTVDILRKYEGAYNMHWISEPDRGQTEALNKGFAMATGDMRAWLNTDEEYLPGALRCVAEKYDANEPLTVIYGDRYQVDVASPSVRTLQRIPPLNPFHYMLYTGRTLFSDATFWTAQIHDDLGCVDEKYMRYAMDVAWLLRVVGIARRFVHVGRPLSIFKEHSSRMSHKAALQDVRLNKPIRVEYSRQHGVGPARLVLGWLWFGARLRVLSHGWRGLIMPPNLGSMWELFWEYRKQNRRK